MPLDLVPQLPTNPLVVARILRDHAAREESKLSWRWLRWLIAGGYLDGYREFAAYDLTGTTISTYALKKDGKIPVQVQDLLVHFNRTLGALSALDLRPSVTQDDGSISSIRERAVAQIITDSLVDRSQLEAVKKMAASLLSALGCCGISGQIADVKNVGLTADLEVVHPREVFPFPSLGWDYTQQTGIMRQRMVPYSTIKRKYGTVPADKVKLLDLQLKKHGEETTSQSSDLGIRTRSPVPAFSGGAIPEDGSTDLLTLVKTRELWMYGPRGTCSRFICASGDHVFQDETYEGEVCYPMLHWMRFYETLTPYGAGLFDIMFSMVREFEKMIESLINNVTALDRYPVTILPHGTVNEKTVYKDTGHPLRLIFANLEPRYAGTGDFRPTVVPIHNAGDMPGRTAAFLRNMVDDIAPVRDIIKAKGRVDSLPALRMLDEEAQKTTANPISSMTSAFGDLYRSITVRAVKSLMTSPRALPVGKLNIELAGAVIDWDARTVTFRRNPMPDIPRLTFTVREGTPRSKSVRKQEALELLSIEGLTDPLSFKLLNIREGLDFAIEDSDIRAAVESFTITALTLFNDGETPGKAWINPHTSRPDVQSKLLADFMGGTTLRAASPAVVNQFIRWRKTLMSYMGNVLPEAVPDPYEQGLIEHLKENMLPTSEQAPVQPAQLALPPA